MINILTVSILRVVLFRCNEVFLCQDIIFFRYNKSRHWKSPNSLMKTLDCISFCWNKWSTRQTQDGVYLQDFVGVRRIMNNLVHFAKTTNCWSDGGCGCGRVHPCAASNNSLASFAWPDSDTRSLHGILAAECAGVFAVLGNFDLLDHFTQWRTISCAVFTNNSNLLGTLGLKKWECWELVDWIKFSSLSTHHFDVICCLSAMRVRIRQEN